MHTVIVYFIFTLSIILYIYSVLQISLRNKTRINYLMSLMFFFFGYFMFYNWMSHMRILESIPFLMYSDISVSFLLGPVIYSYTANITGKSQNYTFNYFLRYLPGITVLFFLFFFNPGGDTISGNSIYPAGHKLFNLIYILSLLSDSQLFIYIFVSAKNFYNFKKESVPPADAVLKRIFYFYLVILTVFPLFLISYLSYNENLIGLGLILCGFDGVYFFILSSRYPEYTQKVIKTSHEKSTKSTLNNIAIPEVIGNLKILFDNEKIYRSSDLTAQSLSNMLNIKTYQLSQIINEEMKTNLRALVNSYRLKEAKHLLISEPAKTIIEIAFEVGFNSKSTFHELFTKDTGLTPTEFRRK